MTLPPGKSRKSTRLRLAKAELLLDLATTAERWSKQETGLSMPAEFERLTRLYDLTDNDLERILHQLGADLENRAVRAGYEDCWTEPEPSKETK